MRIKKPRGDVVIPNKVIKRIRREMGEEGVKLFQLLCELADENGQIRFEGNEEEMMEQLQDIYAVRFGDSEDA
jgi:hypothetical protein